MRRFLFVLAVLTVSSPAYAGGEALAGLSCNVGPLHKTYGGTEWLVYGCSDNQSLVVAAASGSKAAPFTFFFTHDNTGYDLKGKGTGDRKATDAAYKELSALSGKDIRALAAETRKH